MTLPQRLPRKPKRETRWRSQAHCNFVRSHYCCVPGCASQPIEVAHVRNGSGAGVGQKPDDWHTISLCRDHHAEQHRVGERAFEKRHGIEMAVLAEEFVRTSPKRHEIEQVRKERRAA